MKSPPATTTFVNIGVTGTIGSGKSTFSRMLATGLQADHVDTDAIVRRLLTDDREVIERIRSAIPRVRVRPDGAIDRQTMSDLIFQDSDAKGKLEAVLHPVVRAEWTARRDAAAKARRHFLVEIPLLYETHAESELDRVVVVAASERVQRARVTAARGLSEERFDAILRTQNPWHESASRADHLVWNDFSDRVLEAQASQLADYLQ